MTYLVYEAEAANGVVFALKKESEDKDESENKPRIV